VTQVEARPYRIHEIEMFQTKLRNSQHTGHVRVRHAVTSFFYLRADRRALQCVSPMGWLAARRGLKRNNGRWPYLGVVERRAAGGEFNILEYMRKVILCGV